MPSLLEVIDFLLAEARLNYLGQCDKLRRNCAEREGYWQEMMANKKPIDPKKFVKLVDMSPILDDDEDPLGYINQAKLTDPTTQTYVSTWNGAPCAFLQTGGFEFIFV